MCRKLRSGSRTGGALLRTLSYGFEGHFPMKFPFCARESTPLVAGIYPAEDNLALSMHISHYFDFFSKPYTNRVVRLLTLG